MTMFYKDLELVNDEKVYQPREDSFFFADNLEVKPGESVLEIGTGSGLLSIVAAKQGGKVAAVDINPAAVECAKKNAETAGVEVEFLEGDMFEQVSNKYDLIVFNPPYLPGERELEGDEALIDSGTIERFLEEYKDYLKENGRALLIISSLNQIETGGKILAEKKLPFEKLFLVCLS